MTTPGLNGVAAEREELRIPAVGFSGDLRVSDCEVVAVLENGEWSILIGQSLRAPWTRQGRTIRAGPNWDLCRESVAATADEDVHYPLNRAPVTDIMRSCEI